jgi:hypothetical protein
MTTAYNISIERFDNSDRFVNVSYGFTDTDGEERLVTDLVTSRNLGAYILKILQISLVEDANQREDQTIR